MMIGLGTSSTTTIFILFLLMVTTTKIIDAFSGGAGTCTAGNGAIDGTHLTNIPVQTNTLESSGLVVTLNGTPISSITSINRSAIYTIAIKPSGSTTFKGALIRTEFNDFNTGDNDLNDYTLTPGTNAKIETTCTNQSARGITHTDANNKVDFSGVLQVQAIGQLTVDVTVVFSNNANQGSNYRYSQYQFDVVVSGGLAGGIDFPFGGGGGDSSDDDGPGFGVIAIISALLQSGLGCLSGSSTVHVQGKGIISMDQLQIGDYVKTSSTTGDKYSRVYSFAHKDDQIERTYLQIYTISNTTDEDIISNNNNNNPLEITMEHMIMLHGNNNAVIMAKDVKVGDVLMNGKVVTRIDTVQRRGAYAPITEAGNLLVSDVVVSSYVTMIKDDVVPAYIQHYGYHASLAPLRILCTMNFKYYCQNESYTNGISNHILWIVQILWKFTHTYNNTIWVQYILLLCIATPIVVTVFMIEQLLFTSSSPIILLITLLLTTIVFFRHHNGINKISNT